MLSPVDSLFNTDIVHCYQGAGSHWSRSGEYRKHQLMWDQVQFVKFYLCSLHN